MKANVNHSIKQMFHFWRFPQDANLVYYAGRKSEVINEGIVRSSSTVKKGLIPRTPGADTTSPFACQAL